MPEPTGRYSQWYQRLRAAPLLIFAGLAAAAPGSATATSIDMDEFSVTRNGSPLFDDTFNQNTTLNGGTGSTVASGTNFSGDGPADYFVHGAIPETTANNGQALLNTANGIVQTQPDPFFPVISNVNAVLQTGASTTGAHALTPQTSFTVTGLFDLSLPNVVGGTDALTLTNRYAVNSNMGNVLQIRLRDCAPGVGLCGALSGPVLQFVWLNFITNSNTLISEFALTPAELADPQFEFEFMKAANTDVIDACYAFGSGNTLATFNGTPTCFGSTDSSADVFTTLVTGGQTVQPGFEAFEPVPAAVPEPSSLLLTAAGLFAFSAFGRRRRATR